MVISEVERTNTAQFEQQMFFYNEMLIFVIFFHKELNSKLTATKSHAGDKNRS